MATPARRERWLWVVAIAMAALAVCLTGLTLWTVWVARSEVPWRDQWTYLDDAREIMGHHWARLWYSYWGHRVVTARLVTLVDVLYFRGLSSPVLALELAIQAAEAGLLVWMAWRLFAERSRVVFVIAAASIVQLCFSSLQLENFIWAADAGYLLVWTSATAAFLLLAVYAGNKRSGAVVGCVVAGIVSTVSCPNGLLVWPILVLQAWVLRLSVRVRAVLTAAGVAVIGAYFWRYEPGPALGMGIFPALLHPQRSIPILGMLVAGTLTSVSARWAMVVGSLALVGVVYILFKAVRYRPLAPVTVCAALALMGLLTLASLVTSRISPEFVEERVRLHLLVLPSRYYTAIFLFWAALGGVSLWLAMRNRREWPQLVVSVSMIGVATLGTLWWQIGEAANWRGYYREIDIAGSALIMHVDDPANPALAQIYPDAGLRDRVSAWLQQRNLAIFSQKRGHLLGQRVTAGDRVCQGQAQDVAIVSNGVYRIGGWAAIPTRDLTIVDSGGTVVGVARSGLRRPDLHVDIDAPGWQGYARARAGETVAIYGVLDGAGNYCRIGSPIALPIN